MFSKSFSFLVSYSLFRILTPRIMLPPSTCCLNLQSRMFIVSQFYVCYWVIIMSRIVRKPDFCLCENKVAAKLISAFVFATRIVQFLFFLNPKFQLLAHFCDCTGRFVSDLGGHPEDRFSRVLAHNHYHHYLDLRSNKIWQNNKPCVIFHFIPDRYTSFLQ